MRILRRGKTQVNALFPVRSHCPAEFARTQMIRINAAWAAVACADVLRRRTDRAVPESLCALVKPPGQSVDGTAKLEDEIAA
jgi:hypothetical protein